MTSEHMIIKTKVGLPELDKQLGKIFWAYIVLIFTRDRFYHFQELYDISGESFLL